MRRAASAGPSRLPIRPRALERCPLPPAVAPPPRHPVRFSSTSTASGPSGKVAAPAPAPIAAIPHGAAFEALADELNATQPCFGTRGDEVEILAGPEAFYQSLLGMIRRAKRRVLISTLYIGVEEAELIDTLATALAANPALRVTLLLDYNRSTRVSAGEPASTARLVLPLIERFGDRADVRLFRSPKLRGILERLVPPRYNEGWGTWHAKWYAVDDEVIISGANLARSYFTNRQDRYLHLRSHPSFLSYISSFSRLIERYSYRLQPHTPGSASRHFLVPLDASSAAALIWPEPSVHPRAFGAHAHATLGAFQRSWRLSNPARSRRPDADTWFWPVLQSGVLGVREEQAALAAVLAAAGQAGAQIDLTSGYFGLHKVYKRALLETASDVRVVAASPRANGFYGSKGPSGLIPEGYTLLERRFHAAAKEVNPKIRLREWEREGWTYHTKGVWISESGEDPFLTFVGSSNLSTRSLELDSELSLLLSTTSPALRRALAAEVETINAHATDVGDETWARPERRVGWAAKVLVALGVEGML
ncbi:CDP-diacylglycerol--glycerol-3-phosphate 3-phosphatidyltransferase [Cryptotrichosporon argae]